VAPAPNSKAVAEIAPPQAPSMPFVQGNQVFADHNDKAILEPAKALSAVAHSGIKQIASGCRFGLLSNVLGTDKPKRRQP
jgi:hypothetical protein